MEKIKVEKSVATRYTIRSRGDGCHWWADITVSSDGFLNIQSDYGSYHYKWGSFGDSFNNFLITCSPSYVCNKFSYDTPDVFDEEETIKVFLREILDKRKQRDLSETDARECWDLVEEIHGCSNENEYTTFISTHTNILLSKLYNDDWSSIPLIKVTNYQLSAFMKEVWPEFVKILKQEQPAEVLIPA
jgi:hypothetical protein